MADFTPVFQFLLRYEGGYINNPHDIGGETKYGISQKSFPRLDIKHMTKEQAESIYRYHYWNKMSCDSLPQSLALTLFDFAVNSGVDRVVKEVQEALDLTIDGVFGPKTLQAIQDLDEKGIRVLTSRINDVRLQLYVRLASNPTQRIFLLGWLRRLMALQGEV